MTTAVKAIGYPKPHARKVGCTGIGTADTSSRYTAFRCKATYALHRSRRFQVGGQGEGGWLCAGMTIASCKVLKKGFVSSATVKTEGFNAAANLAAGGWMSNKYGAAGFQVTQFCTTPLSTSGASYTCGFHVARGDVTLGLTFTVAKGGDVLTASLS